MPHRALKAIGFTLVGLIFAGLAVTVISAALNGRLFYGANVYGLTLWTSGALVVLVVAAGMLTIKACQFLYRAWKKQT